MNKYINKNILICFAAIAALAGLFLLLKQNKNISEPLSVMPNQIKETANLIATSSAPAVEKKLEIKKPEAQIDPTKISPISGIACVNYNRRPVAVMIANDAAARPISGLGEADMVFEMQVVTDSITRLMAVFVCNSPSAVGSVRSARHDFTPLAMGINAIFAHWGGSHYALDDLNSRVMNNIDALKNPYSAFYRKSGIPAPHNGFTSITKLLNSAGKLGYLLTNQFSGYPHLASNSSRQNSDNKIKINYTYPFNIEWQYNSATNLYARWRGGKKEIDKNNSQQVKAANIVVMRADSRTIEGQYNDVDVEGEGKVEVYQNGEKIEGTWKKDKTDLKSKLYFLNNKGEEIKFVPGQIWVEIIELTK